MTPCSDTAASESGETKRAAFGVRTQRTSAPASRKRRTRSGVLYAAIPPEMPRTMRMFAVCSARFAEDCEPQTAICDLFGRRFECRGLFDRRRQLPLHLV